MPDAVGVGATQRGEAWGRGRLGPQVRWAGSKGSVPTQRVEGLLVGRKTSVNWGGPEMEEHVIEHVCGVPGQQVAQSGAVGSSVFRGHL